MTILSAVGISKRYESTAGGISVLKDLNFELSAGERVAIVGASGAGKSTLLNVLGGLDRATSGQVLLGDRDLTNLDEGALCEWRNQNLGFVFQFHHLMPEFSALEAVAMPAEIAGKTRQEAMALAEELLVRLGLSERLHHRPNRLSGGEKQRVAIGRALINRPLCLLMDEPTGNLDPLTAESVMALMRDVVFEATSFVIVATRANRSPEEGGLALTYALIVPYFVVTISDLFVQLRTALAALERLLEYTAIVQEAPHDLPADPTPAAWPSCDHCPLNVVRRRHKPQPEQRRRGPERRQGGGVCQAGR